MTADATQPGSGAVGPYRITLAGEIDILHEKTLADLAAGFEASALTDVVVDLAAVEFMDSSGLSFLLRLQRTAQERGGTVTVTGARPVVRRTMQIVGMHLVIRGVTEVEEPEPR